MVNEQTNFSSKLNELRAKFAERLPEKVSKLRAAVEEIKVGKSSPDSMKEFHRFIHNLAGSGSTFGFLQVSEKCRELEALILRIISQSGKLQTADRETIDSLVESIADAAQKPDKGVSVLQLISATDQKAARDNRNVFLVEEDPLLAQDVAAQISHYGYAVKKFDNLGGFRESVVESPPAVIIMDIALPEGDAAGTAAIAKIAEELRPNVPVIFISTRADLEARLAAVRAGARAYFTKPINVSALIEKINEITAETDPDPYRVMLVDDDADISKAYSEILGGSGMRTHIVNESNQILQAISEFSPDLIFMDLYMPGTTGMELASVIRQHESLIGVPIVFLSTEQNLTIQFAAMESGADDFLQKPMRPENLISTAQARIRRYRQIRSFMVSDSLTGLLNHSRILEFLDVELSRSVRANQPLAIAMIDLDNFKKVNDTYGHPIGDRVIKSVASLLKKRLRKTDIAGRYGGEEFAVILPGTTEEGAQKVLNEVRESFSKIRNQAAGTSFHVTFSAGIAGFPLYRDATTILEAADTALYESKKNGKNLVTIAW